jgi:nucleoside-triphosphatase THEP1
VKERIIHIITGGQGAGKTTFLQEMIFGLAKSNIQLGGILAEGFWKNYERDHFKLIDLKSNNSILYCQRETKKGWKKWRHFYINPEGQKFGELALDPDYIAESELIVIDEVGPFELKGKGWANSIRKILDKLPDKTMIWVIRKHLLDDVYAHFNIQPYKVYHIEAVCAENAVSSVLKSLITK